jgi:DNA polymerase III epsilon subunit-like protein
MNNNNLIAKTFVAVDVEWATRDQMICQIGLVVVRNGEIVERAE